MPQYYNPHSMAGNLMGQQQQQQQQQQNPQQYPVVGAAPNSIPQPQQYPPNMANSPAAYYSQQQQQPPRPVYPYQMAHGMAPNQYNQMPPNMVYQQQQPQQQPQRLFNPNSVNENNFAAATQQQQVNIPNRYPQSSTPASVVQQASPAPAPTGQPQQQLHPSTHLTHQASPVPPPMPTVVSAPPPPPPAPATQPQQHQPSPTPLTLSLQLQQPHQSPGHHSMPPILPYSQPQQAALNPGYPPAHMNQMKLPEDLSKLQGQPPTTNPMGTNILAAKLTSNIQQMQPQPAQPAPRQNTNLTNNGHYPQPSYHHHHHHHQHHHSHHKSSPLVVQHQQQGAAASPAPSSFTQPAHPQQAKKELVFPAESVEAYQPTELKKRKINSKDLGNDLRILFYFFPNSESKINLNIIVK